MTDEMLLFIYLHWFFFSSDCTPPLRFHDVRLENRKSSGVRLGTSISTFYRLHQYFTCNTGGHYLNVPLDMKNECQPTYPVCLGRLNAPSLFCAY